ncbi:MAG: hypothetical protein ACLUVC_07335 [Longibaculum sp.]
MTSPVLSSNSRFSTYPAAPYEVAFVYYAISNLPYILAYEYSKDKIYVSSYEGNYDSESSLYPTLDSFIDYIQSIILPKTNHKITIVSDDQRDAEMVYYPLNMNTYLKVESYEI